MAGTARPTARGTLDTVALQQKLERGARRTAQKRQQTPTHPIYPGLPAEAVEAQIAFSAGGVRDGQQDAEVPYYRAGGEWHRFAGEVGWIPFITVAATIDGTDSTSGADIPVDFSGAGFVESNDGGTLFSPWTSPHTSDYFGFDWGDDPNTLQLLKSGIYWIRGAFWIPATAMNDDPDIFQVKAHVGGANELGGINTPADKTQTFLGGANAAASASPNFVASYSGLTHVASTRDLTLTVQHTAGAIDSASDTFALLQAAYLGLLTKPT